MDQPLSLKWSRAQSLSRRSTYRKLLGARLALDLIIALAAMAVPGALARLLGLDGEDVPVMIRLWGGMLLLAASLHVPGLLEPVRWRWTNAVGMVARSLLALLYLLSGGLFVWLGVIEIVFVFLLAITYFALFKAELMSRP